MTKLPDSFQFSQGSLQDFVDCPRRFLLRYVLDVAWPAVEAEPAIARERHIQQGAAFHRLVHQHLLGLPADRLTRMVDDARDPDLSRWWRSYLKHAPRDLPPRPYPELALSTPLGEARLVARYDLVAVEPGSLAVIVDWKTGRKPPRRLLLNRLQTTVYRYVLVHAGVHLNGGEAIQPEQVEMLYWFTDAPENPERLPYEAAQFEADAARLESLLADIIAREGEADFPLTEDVGHCRYCLYRSLCQRGVEAGTFDAMEDLPEEDAFGLDFAFDQIAEIEF